MYKSKELIFILSVFHKEENLRNHDIKALSKHTVRYSTMHTESEFLLREHPARIPLEECKVGRKSLIMRL